MMSPDSTRKLTTPVHLLRRRCNTNATIAASTTIAVTLHTVRMVLLMNAMMSM
jgi:hypothetical protein